jgi:hypothetical protein
VEIAANRRGGIRALGSSACRPREAMRDAAIRQLCDGCVLRKVRYRIQQLCRLDLIGAQIALAAQQLNLEFRAAEHKTVLAGLAGNVLEWYDFGVYGLYASPSARNSFARAIRPSR